MQVTFIKLLARTISRLPLKYCQKLGAMVGRLIWLTNSSPRRVTEFNVAHCFPDMNKPQRQALAKQSILHTGKQVAECAWIWHRPISQTSVFIKEVRGEDLFTDAIASERGVIVVTPHMGNWEICSLPLSEKAPFTFFYRPPRNPQLVPVLLKWRAHLRGMPASLDAGGIREGMRILKKGGMVGILPDQEPDPDNGVYAPFFGQSALTMTLLPRLAARSNAQIIYIVVERLDEAKGWRIHYLPADPETLDKDPVKAATAVNRDVERCIAISPPQYLWDYKRFNTREDGSRRRYPK